VVLTTLPSDKYTAEKILSLYRLRWQVELFFKRIKSIGGMRRLPVWNERSAEVYALAKKLFFIFMDADTFLPPVAPHGDGDTWDEDFDGGGMDDDFLWEEFRRQCRRCEAMLAHRVPDAHVADYRRIRASQHERELRRRRKRSLQMYKTSCQRAMQVAGETSA
jgi:hypothetical protein